MNSAFRRNWLSSLSFCSCVPLNTSPFGKPIIWRRRSARAFYIVSMKYMPYSRVTHIHSSATSTSQQGSSPSRTSNHSRESCQSASTPWRRCSHLTTGYDPDRSSGLQARSCHRKQASGNAKGRTVLQSVSMHCIVHSKIEPPTVDRIVASHPGVALVPRRNLFPQPDAAILVIFVVPEGGIISHIVGVPVRVLAARNRVQVENGVDLVFRTLRMHHQ